MAARRAWAGDGTWLHRLSRRRTLVEVRSCLSLALLCLALAPSAAAAAPRPDLQVRGVGSGSSQEAPGSRFTGTATVLNLGSRTAARSRLGFYLSRDRRKGSGDFRLRPRPLLRPRRPGTRIRVRRTLTVPAGVPAGSFALIACADDTRRVRERRERNNCRSATRRIRIVTAGPQPPSQPPVPVPGTGVAGPSISITGPPNGTLTFDNTPTYSGAAGSFTTAIARVEAKLDAGPFSTAGVTCAGCGNRVATWSFTPTPVPDGPHVFAFRAIDAAGRSSPILTRSLTVDTTAPTFNSITATPASTSVTATFSEPPACITVNPFDFTAEVADVPVAVNSVTCSPNSATVTLVLASAPGAGQNVEVTLSGVISDPAGNVVPQPTVRSDTA